MRLGLIARADNTGLGNQTYQFYKHMQPAKTMVVDISGLNGNRIYPERYPDGQFVSGFPRPADIDSFLEDLDVVFVAEAPYNYYLYERARQLGVKTAVQYNYEFFDWFANPHYPKPDMVIAPSTWHFEEVDKWAAEHGVHHQYLHCPVDRADLPPREIRKARLFLHLAGKPAAHDRNGTKTVIEASNYLQTEAMIIVHFQGEQGLAHQVTTSVEEYRQFAYDNANPHLIIRQEEYDNYSDIYNDADVLVLPRRYGGNCLPMNEALSIGMPVIMTDLDPQFVTLPEEWLVPAVKIGEFTPRTTIDIYTADAHQLAAKIDELYNADETTMLGWNNDAITIGSFYSWETQKPNYLEALEQLCSQ